MEMLDLARVLVTALAVALVFRLLLWALRPARTPEIILGHPVWGGNGKGYSKGGPRHRATAIFQEN